jgi:hypothetical protein
MTETGPRRIVIGSYESGAHLVVIPRQVLTRANQVFDAERARREAEAVSANASRVKAMRGARAMRRLKKVLTLLRGSAR